MSKNCSSLPDAVKMSMSRHMSCHVISVSRVRKNVTSAILMSLENLAALGLTLAGSMISQATQFDTQFMRSINLIAFLACDGFLDQF